jgi:hypothetical protein
VLELCRITDGDSGQESGRVMRLRSGKGYVDVTATDCLGDAGGSGSGSLYTRLGVFSVEDSKVRDSCLGG